MVVVQKQNRVYSQLRKSITFNNTCYLLREFHRYVTSEKVSCLLVCVVTNRNYVHCSKCPDQNRKDATTPHYSTHHNCARMKEDKVFELLSLTAVLLEFFCCNYFWPPFRWLCIVYDFCLLRETEKVFICV